MVCVAKGAVLVLLDDGSGFRALVVTVASFRCAKHPMLRYNMKSKDVDSRPSAVDILGVVEDIFIIVNVDVRQSRKEQGR